jgi:hypothetical protein
MKPSPRRPTLPAVDERGLAALDHHARLAAAYAELARELTRVRDKARRLAARFRRRAAAVARRLGVPAEVLAELVPFLPAEKSFRKRRQTSTHKKRVPRGRRWPRRG